MMKNEELISDLQKIVGNENLSDRIFDRISYSQDGMRQDFKIENTPIAVVKPISGQQVSRIVKYANTRRLPIYVQGAATTFKGSPRPKRPGSIILNTQNLTSLEIHEDDLYLEAGAGLNQYFLERKLSERGYFLPMNIGSKNSSTIGGAVAVNTIGHMVDICLGKIIDYVMGVEVVTPTGEILETGTRSIRRPAGIDYTRFFVGFEGLFGIITKVRLRLLPDFKKGFVVGFFPELANLGRAFMRLYREKLPPPLYGEFLDKDACDPLFKLKGIGEPKGHMALVVTVGHSQEEADRRAEDIVEVFNKESAVEARIVISPDEQEVYQQTRDAVSNILQMPIDGERMVYAGGLEAAVPLSHLAEVIPYLKGGHDYRTLLEAKGFTLGHVGTSDIHGMWLCPKTWEREKRLQCAREAVRLEADINLRWGCASGEVGQTGVRLPFLRKRYGEGAYSMLVSVKRALDPNDILNPGNIEGEL